LANIVSALPVPSNLFLPLATGIPIPPDTLLFYIERMQSSNTFLRTAAAAWFSEVNNCGGGSEFAFSISEKIELRGH